MTTPDEQRAIAEAASQGEWATSKGKARRVTARGKIICTAVLANGPGRANVKSDEEARANARHIATFDPPTMIAFFDERDALLARLAALEAERALPDIGVEPLTLPRPREWDDTLARLRGPMVLQQSGVPRGAALVWRTDLLDMRHRLIRMTALAEMRAEKIEAERAAGEARVVELEAYVRKMIPTNMSLDNHHWPDDTNVPLDVPLGDLRQGRDLLAKQEPGS